MLFPRLVHFKVNLTYYYHLLLNLALLEIVEDTTAIFIIFEMIDMRTEQQNIFKFFFFVFSSHVNLLHCISVFDCGYLHLHHCLKPRSLDESIEKHINTPL